MVSWWMLFTFLALLVMKKERTAERVLEGKGQVNSVGASVGFEDCIKYGPASVSSHKLLSTLGGMSMILFLGIEE